MAKSKNDSSSQRALTEAAATKAAAAAAVAAAGKKKKKTSIYSTLSPTQVFLAALAVIALLLGWAVVTKEEHAHAHTKDADEKTDSGNDAARGRNLSAARNKDSFVVGAYLPDYRFYIGNIKESSLLLTDLLLFSVDPVAYTEGATTETLSPLDNNIFQNTCCLSTDHFQRAKEAVDASESLNLWVTIGGAGRVAGTTSWFVAGMNSIETAVKGPEGPWHLYVQHLLAYAQIQQLKGIDLDCSGVLGVVKSQEDFMAYMTFLQFVMAALDQNGVKTSAALHKGMHLPAPLYKTADRIHLMTYGMIQGEDAGHHHASMKGVKAAVASLIESGCPPNKIVLGIPAYAMHSQSGDVKTFAEIYDGTLDKSVIDKQHTWSGYSYDSPSDIRAKVKYAAKEKLRGVFLWEMGQDKQGSEENPAGILVQAMADGAAAILTNAKASPDEGAAPAPDQPVEEEL